MHCSKACSVRQNDLRSHASHVQPAGNNSLLGRLHNRDKAQEDTHWVYICFYIRNVHEIKKTNMVAVLTTAVTLNAAFDFNVDPARPSQQPLGVYSFK